MEMNKLLIALLFMMIVGTYLTFSYFQDFGTEKYELRKKIAQLKEDNKKIALEKKRYQEYVAFLKGSKIEKYKAEEIIEKLKHIKTFSVNRKDNNSFFIQLSAQKKNLKVWEVIYIYEYMKNLFGWQHINLEKITPITIEVSS